MLEWDVRPEINSNTKTKEKAAEKIEFSEHFSIGVFFLFSPLPLSPYLDFRITFGLRLLN